MGLLQRLLFSCGLVLALPLLGGKLHGASPVLIAYGGFNETMAPLWVGVEKGLFRKYGVDAQVLQTRSGQIMMATLATGGASLVWAAPSAWRPLERRQKAIRRGQAQPRRAGRPRSTAARAAPP